MVRTIERMSKATKTVAIVFQVSIYPHSGAATLPHEL